MKDYCLPSFDTVKNLARRGNLIPIYREILADLETPVSAFMKISTSDYAFLLESVEGGEKWGRFSFLGASPRLLFRSKGRSAEWIENGRPRSFHVSTTPLDLIKERLDRYVPVPVEGLPRFFGGMVGYFSYDVAGFFEDLPDRLPDDLGLPDCYLMLADTILIFDNVRHSIKIVHNLYLPDYRDLDEAYRAASSAIAGVENLLAAPLEVPGGGPESGASGRAPEFRDNLTSSEYCRAVGKAKTYIENGDIIQVVLSRRLEAEAPSSTFDLYRALRMINPSPYMFYLHMGELSLAGASPETLVRLEDGRVDVRPIAGTRPRGENEEEDRRIEEELKADPKERAEHVMLVDLGRNDVGRVASVGSVCVDEFMTVERYSHVMHLVSHVRGELASGRSPYDVIAACLPAGTLSGAPKIRAMEIIEELEPVKRGIYGGAVGYIGFNQNLDLAIAIRTILATGGSVYVQAGAGIVADSVAEREHEECSNKARAMIRAVEMAESGLGDSLR